MVQLRKVCRAKGLNTKPLAIKLGENPTNFGRKFRLYLDRLNKWVEPLGLEVDLKEKPPA